MKQISFAIEAYDQYGIMRNKWRDIVSYERACQIADLLMGIKSDYIYKIKRIEYIEEVMPWPSH
jgi:hypothetical protein